MLISSLIGLVSGFFNGLFGSGGGTIVVPAMEKFKKTETHKAHATAIAVILPLTIVSIAVYFKSAKPDWIAVLIISAGGVIGGFIGAKLLNKLSSVWIRRVFGIAMFIAGVRMLF